MKQLRRLVAGADVNYDNDDGWTPLCATEKGHLEIFQALKIAALLADVNKAEEDGCTPLGILQKRVILK